MRKITTTLIIFCLGAGAGVTYHGEINSIINNHLLQGSGNTQKSVPGLDIIDYDINTPHHNHNDNQNPDNKDQAPKSAGSPKIGLCFTPSYHHCGELITRIIDKARQTIYVQAYGLTHPEIINSLIKAKQRDVEVKVLLDRSNKNAKHSGMQQLKVAGIEVNIDMVPGIAHNKVMIIDKLITVTGSFNFTKAADTKNAENVVIIADPDVAYSYLQNWLYRKEVNQRKEIKK